MKDRRSLPVLKSRQAAVENATIPLKEKLTQVKDRKGDEKGREHVYRVVKMTEQHYDRKKDRPGEKYVAKWLYVPKDQREEEGRSGVSREEHVVAADEFLYDRSPILNVDLIRKWA